MNFFLLTYADKKFEEKQSNLIRFSQDNNIFDGYFTCNRESLIKTDFYKENKEILDSERGGGYWLWKPYFILESLKQVEYGDCVFYIDCGDMIKKNIISFLSRYMINNELMITSGTVIPNYKYTTKKCFSLMGCDEEKYYNFVQIEAGMICMKKTDSSIAFVQEWLSYAKNKDIITDINNKDPENHKDFIDHRHDQSILTNLLAKYNIPSTTEIRNYAECNVYD